MLRPSSRISPWQLAPGMSSFIRLSARRKVDLPQPDGPMRAVTCRSISSMDTPLTAAFSPYRMERSRVCILARASLLSVLMSVASLGLAARPGADGDRHGVQGKGEDEKDEHRRVEEGPGGLHV